MNCSKNLFLSAFICVFLISSCKSNNNTEESEIPLKTFLFWNFDNYDENIVKIVQDKIKNSIEEADKIHFVEFSGMDLNDHLQSWPIEKLRQTVLFYVLNITAEKRICTNYIYLLKDRITKKLIGL
jgi:hypothetical protein